MGKSKILRYVVRRARFGEPSGDYLGPWVIKDHGAPTSENLARWRENFNLSTMPGGSNEHLGPAHWIASALVVWDQVMNRAVCWADAPKFETIPTAEEARALRTLRGLYNAPDAAPTIPVLARRLEAARDTFERAKETARETQAANTAALAAVIRASEAVKAASDALQAATAAAPTFDTYAPGDQPQTCPKCGTRTDYTDGGDGSQAHQCPQCRYRFDVIPDRKPAPLKLSGKFQPAPRPRLARYDWIPGHLPPPRPGRRAARANFDAHRPPTFPDDLRILCLTGAYMAVTRDHRGQPFMRRLRLAVDLLNLGAFAPGTPKADRRPLSIHFPKSTT